MPDVKVTLTKHTEKAGYRILLKSSNEATEGTVFAEDILNGGNVYFTCTDFSLWKDVQKQLPEGVTLSIYKEASEATNWQIIYEIGNITSDITLIGNVCYNSGNCIDVSGGTPITSLDTKVGTVKLDASNNWISHFENLEIADDITYTIDEVSVDGYTASYTLNSETLAVGEAFKLGKNSGVGDTIVITNTADETGGYELPSTGGAGTTPYTAVGGAIALAALVCGLCQKRRRERRAHN